MAARLARLRSPRSSWPFTRTEWDPAAMKVKYFKSPAEFRRWLEKNHATTQELWVGYYKKSSEQPSITWPESVDEALCFGGSMGFVRAWTILATQVASPRGDGEAFGARSTSSAHR